MQSTNNKRQVNTIPHDVVQNSKRLRGPIPVIGVNRPNPDFPLLRPITPRQIQQNHLQNQRYVFPTQQTLSGKSQLPHTHQPVSINSIQFQNNQKKSCLTPLYRNSSGTTIQANLNPTMTSVVIPSPAFKSKTIQVAAPILSKVPSKVEVPAPLVSSKMTNSIDFKKKTWVVLPTTIGGMRDWMEYKERFRFLFELVGSLDSAVTRNERRTGKSFLLKDISGTVKCIFYEVDRNLPRVVRGQCLRCVGNFDEENEVVQCYSVRTASSDEIKCLQNRIDISNNLIFSSMKNSAQT